MDVFSEETLRADLAAYEQRRDQALGQANQAAGVIHYLGEKLKALAGDRRVLPFANGESPSVSE